MANDVYQRLARHLDDLPAGYPATESGVELRILRRLFTPEQAELALHLTLLGEKPRVIARRAGVSPTEAADKLENMALKGLIYRSRGKDGEASYSANQFVVGIWEFQVNSLDEELIRDFEEYLPHFYHEESWRRFPQIRTVPVGESIPVQAEVLPYEQAETIVRKHSRLAVAPCICRRERKLVGEGCDRPEEACLVFGSAADYYLENGMARTITLEEALGILDLAEETGLVLQPGNSKKSGNICCCCGCCCGVLRTAKQQPNPASVLWSPFVADVDDGNCEGCGICLDRCPMDALELHGGVAVRDIDRCIGCGLCVTTCPSGALTMVRRAEDEIKYVPRNTVEEYVRLGRVRGKMGVGDMLGMVVRSGVDRLLSR